MRRTWLKKSFRTGSRLPGAVRRVDGLSARGDIDEVGSFRVATDNRRLYNRRPLQRDNGALQVSLPY